MLNPVLPDSLQTNLNLDFLTVSNEPSPVPSKFKEPGYITAEVPDRKHGRVTFSTFYSLILYKISS